MRRLATGWRWCGFFILGAFACSSPKREFPDGHAGDAGDAGTSSDEGGKRATAGSAGRAGANSSDAGQGGTEPAEEAGAAGQNADEGGSSNGGSGGSTGTAGNGGTTGNGGTAGKGGSGGTAANGGTAGKGGSGGTAANGGTAGKGGSGGTAGTGGAPALLADGAVCSSNSECSSNSCGGRCCPVGKPCTCPQPSAKNLLNNPGFDGNVSGWTVTSSVGSGSFHWVAVSSNDQDATACPYSGFGRIYSNGVTTVSQCVAVSTSKSYNVSTSLSNGSHGDFSDGFGELDCNLDWFTGANCTGSSPVLPDGALSTSWINVDWWQGVWSGGPWFPPAGVVSARLSCSGTCSGSDPCYTNVDKMGVVEAPATY